MEIINLNLIPTGTRPVVHASQYDNGRQFRANLFEGASVYTLTGAETLTFSVRKPDGHIVTEAVTNTSDNYVVIETTTQMCACAGDSFAELKIENGDDLIGTLNLILAVEQSPEEGGDPSESFIHNLEEQIAEAVADQYDADSVIFDNTPTQGHGIGFAVTSEGVATAVQDAKDYTDTVIGGLSIPENITDLADTDINNPTNGEIMVYNNGSWENQANPSSTQNFAPDYDDTATYNTNDKVIYQGLLYVCLEDSVTGAWDSTKWQNISVADFTADLLPIESGSSTNTKDYVDSGLSGKQSSLTYESDDYNVATYGGIIRCKKWGRIVNIEGYGIGSVTTVPTGAAYTFTTIAEKYRPLVQQHVMGSANAQSYKYDLGQFYRVNTDGTIVVYVYAGTNFIAGCFNVTYIV